MDRRENKEGAAKLTFCYTPFGAGVLTELTHKRSKIKGFRQSIHSINSKN